MTTALDCAYYFAQRGMVEPRNTFDGNMKLQKLLFFADMISLAETGKPLFDDPVYAFDKGCVVESVRPMYKYKYDEFAKQAESFDSDTLERVDRDVLDKTIGIFGNSSARDLSDACHHLSCWINAFERAKESKRRRDSLITVDAMRDDARMLAGFLEAYETAENENEKMSVEVINGISFYYDPEEITMDDELREELIGYTEDGWTEPSYVVYKDDGELVVY